MILGVALGLGGCASDGSIDPRVYTTIQATCAVETVAWGYYLTVIAPTKSEASVAKATQAHNAVQLACEVGATLAQVEAAKVKAEAERAK